MIFTIGEALIDFVPHEKGRELKNVESFYKMPGGAPANVACAVSKLGGSSAFIGKVGDDAFGETIIEKLRCFKVNTDYILKTKEANTALAFVSLKEDGNRDFSFYRNPSADMLLDENEIDGSWFTCEDIIHYCSVDLIEAPVKYAHIKAINSIKIAGGIVSFDPNVRLPLWQDENQCRNTILEFIPKSHILKISDEELEFITGIKEKEEAIYSLFKGEVKLIVYTKGKNGSEMYTKDFMVNVQGIDVKAVDTTGAGDAFVGAMLYLIDKEKININKLTKEEAIKIIDFANNYAALSTTQKGAMDSYKNFDEFIHYLGQ